MLRSKLWVTRPSRRSNPDPNLVQFLRLRKVSQLLCRSQSSEDAGLRRNHSKRGAADEREREGVYRGAIREELLAVVKGEITQPYADRGHEGSLPIFTEFSPMGDPAFEPGRPSEMAMELGRIIDRGLRNLVDATNLAALAALLFYRRPECTVRGDDGQEIIVHPPEVREPVGLIIHHLPIAVMFAFFDDGNFQVVDPSLKEEEVMGGRVTITVNAQGDICAVQ